MNQKLFAPIIDPRNDSHHERKQPHEQYIRRGDSPYWFSYTIECPYCGLFFALSWPRGVEKVEPVDAVMIECPGCSQDFGTIANNLIGAWDHPGMKIGYVRRIETLYARMGTRST